LQGRLAWERLWEPGCAAEVPVCTRREAFDSRSHLQDLLPGTILGEGRGLQAA